MRRWVIGLSAMGALAAAGAFAHDRGGFNARFREGPGGRGGWAAPMSRDDRAAFTDARVAALHAGLKLNPDQEKLWPELETAIRGWVKMRQDSREALRDRLTAVASEGPRDMPGALRAMADRRSASADALRKLADASTPLYAVLDDAQKRRMAVLGRGLQPGMGHRGGMERGGPERGGMERGGMERGGPGRDGGAMRRG